MRSVVEFLDARDHHRSLLLQKLQATDWSPVFAENNVNNATSKFHCLSHKEFKSCFPSIRAKMSSKDPPFMSPLLKHLLSKRNKLLRKGMALEAGLLQPRITQLIKENQLNRFRINNKKHLTGSRLWLKMHGNMAT